MNFSNRVALVTGSSSGIGAAIACELASGGAKVAVHYRGNEAGAHAVQEKIASGGGVCRIYQADVSDTGQAAALVKQVQGDLGSLDILVNNAGMTRDTLLMTMKEEDWDVVIHTNLRSVFTVTKAALRSMVKQRWGAHHQHHQRRRSVRAGGPVKLCGEQSGDDRFHQKPGARGGQPQHHRQRCGPRVYPDCAD